MNWKKIFDRILILSRSLRRSFGGRRPLGSSSGNEPREIVVPIPPRRRIGFHVLLFVLTIASTYVVGLGDGPIGALWYSGGLVLILLTHEMGHFLAAKKHRVRATLPYFIPFPLPPFGTMGAVIKMEGRIPDRRALLDVGAAGPLSGLVMIVPAILIGLKLSTVQEVRTLGATAIRLGDSILFTGLSRIVFGPLPPGHDVVLHPLAFAGWAGLLVTAMNLLPVGQLDGGHLLYALFWKRSRLVSNVFYGVFLFLCLFVYAGWLLLVIVLAFFRTHPPTLDDSLALNPARKTVGVLALILFVLAFTPIPFGMTDGLIQMLLDFVRR